MLRSFPITSLSLARRSAGFMVQSRCAIGRCCGSSHTSRCDSGHTPDTAIAKDWRTSAFAELRTYPTPCCLHYGRVGLTASLLLAVLSHRLADALRSTDRGTTPGSWPSLGACALGRSLKTSLHRDPSSARWLQATSSSHSAPLRAGIR